jgi:hypothetical protein
MEMLNGEIMRVKRKYVLAIVAIVVLLVGCPWALQVKKINEEYPNPAETIHPMNQRVALTEDSSLYVTVKSADIMSASLARKRMPEMFSTLSLSFDEFVLISVIAEVENATPFEQNIEPIRRAMVTVNKNYANGLNQFGLIEFCQASGTELLSTVPAFDKIEVVNIYTLTSNRFSASTWENLPEQDFYLTYRLYPSVERVQLEIRSENDTPTIDCDKTWA